MNLSNSIDWENRNVLVTGGAGFIGSHLVDRLMSLGSKVTVLDNLMASTKKYIEQYMKNDKFRFIKGDIRNDSDLKKAFDRKYDLVFHFAADPDVKKSVENPQQSFEINVVGTYKILEFMRKTDSEKMIFASSGGTVYGDVDVIPVPETVPPKPISPYGASKVAGEAYISAYAGAYGFSAISLRLANIFGARSTHGVMYDFYMKLKKNPKELLILGNGQQKKSYLYVTDCVDATILLAEQVKKIRDFDVYNVGSEEWNTVNEIAQIVTTELGLTNVKFKYTGTERGWPGDVKRIILDITKLKSLGWSPKIDFISGAKEYIRWLKNNF
ncbi:MAG: SDR family NAD(P)-dependent oxidoreductase [Candidatus Odinarchaeota archaeon]|nr:SDR family NAD(P)-dependent oxidoreductase [Candidatus Odinarchaeota archaeon]